MYNPEKLKQIVINNLIMKHKKLIIITFIELDLFVYDKKRKGIALIEVGITNLD